MRITLEVCVDSLAGALAAAEGGADRLELCAALDVGGLTPDAALLREVKRRVSLPVMAMARPRPGGFVLTAAEIAATLDDAARLLDAGADGIVFGCLTEARDVNADATRAMVALVGGRDAVFHRAIDDARDPLSQIDALVDAGVTRVLTSGGRDAAPLGASTIRAMVERAAGRVAIMPGGGLDPTNLADVIRITGATEAHGSFSRRVGDRRVTDAAIVAAARAAM